MDRCRQAAIDIAVKLRRAGHEALLAGGCVRDELLGRRPTDWDVATDATPQQVKSLFRGSKSVGEAFGVMLVRRAGCTVEVATFRAEGPYCDHRRPESVAFTDARQDAMRRDFTVNGLFRDPETDEVIDHVGGRADLEDRRLRAIGDPADRIGEDHLRMLRAVRFAAVLDFQIDPATADAIRAHAGGISGVSPERVGEEFRRMLCSSGAVRGMELLADLGLEPSVLGAVHAGGDHRHLQLAVKGDLDWPSRLAAIALDREVGAETIAGQWGASMVLSNAARDGACAILDVMRAIGRWGDMTVAARRRCGGADGIEAALVLLQVEDELAAGHIGGQIEVWKESPGGVLPPRLVDGHALLDQGVGAGPGLGRLLEALYDAQLEGRVTTREQGLQLARSIHETGF